MNGNMRWNLNDGQKYSASQLDCAARLDFHTGGSDLCSDQRGHEVTYDQAGPSIHILDIRTTTCKFRSTVQISKSGGSYRSHVSHAGK